MYELLFYHSYFLVLQANFIALSRSFMSSIISAASHSGLSLPNVEVRCGAGMSGENITNLEIFSKHRSRVVYASTMS